MFIWTCLFFLLIDNEQRTAFIKELNKLKEYLYEQNQNKTKVTLIYSKILLFLSSLSSIERETVEKIFFPKMARWSCLFSSQIVIIFFFENCIKHRE